MAAAVGLGGMVDVLGAKVLGAVAGRGAVVFVGLVFAAVVAGREIVLVAVVSVVGFLAVNNTNFNARIRGKN